MYIQVTYKSGRVKVIKSLKAWVEEDMFMSDDGEESFKEDKIQRLAFSDKVEEFKHFVD